MGECCLLTHRISESRKPWGDPHASGGTQNLVLGSHLQGKARSPRCELSATQASEINPGTNGDVSLAPVDAMLGESIIHSSGKIYKDGNDSGKTVALDFVTEKGRTEGARVYEAAEKRRGAGAGEDHRDV